METFYIQVRYANKSLTEKDDFQKLIEQVLVYSKGQFKPNKPYEPYALDKFKYKVVEKRGRDKNANRREDTSRFLKKANTTLWKPSRGSTGLKETWASGTVLTGNASGKFFDQYLSPRADIDGLGTLYKVEGIGEHGLGYPVFYWPQTAKRYKREILLWRSPGEAPRDRGGQSEKIQADHQFLRLQCKFWQHPP